MAYTKTLWKNRLVERPRTFKMLQNADGSVTLDPAEGQIIEQGTPINAGNLNKIEDTLEAHETQLAQIPTFQTAGGTATAITLTGVSLTDGYSKTFIISADNSGSATTINGKNLYKPNTTTAPNLVAGKAVTVWYNLISDCFFIKASAEGTATTAQVLAGVPFSNENDTGLVGTMPDNGSQTATLSITGSTKPTKTIPSGYTTGGTVTAQLSSALASSIKSGVTIGGVAGTYNKIYGAGDTLTYEQLGFSKPFIHGFYYDSTSTGISKCDCDSSGNVYLKGTNKVIKVDKNGNLVSTTTISGIADIFIHDNYAYVTRSTYYVTKYTLDFATVVWSVDLSTIQSDITSASQLFVDSSGVYVSCSQSCVIKLTLTGIKSWVYNNSATTQGYGIAKYGDIVAYVSKGSTYPYVETINSTTGANIASISSDESGSDYGLVMTKDFIIHGNDKLSHNLYDLGSMPTIITRNLFADNTKNLLYYANVSDIGCYDLTTSTFVWQGFMGSDASAISRHLPVVIPTNTYVHNIIIESITL